MKYNLLWFVSRRARRSQRWARITSLSSANSSRSPRASLLSVFAFMLNSISLTDPRPWQSLMDSPPLRRSWIQSYEDNSADSGKTITRMFCKACGSGIYSRPDSIPDKLFLKAGTLDDMSQVRPNTEIVSRYLQRIKWPTGGFSHRWMFGVPVRRTRDQRDTWVSL